MEANKQTQERFQVLRDANRKPKLYLIDNAQDGASLCTLPLHAENERFFNDIAEMLNVKAESGKGPKELAERVKELETKIAANNFAGALNKEMIELENDKLEGHNIGLMTDVVLLTAENKALAERVKELEDMLRDLNRPIDAFWNDTNRIANIRSHEISINCQQKRAYKALNK